MTYVRHFGRPDKFITFTCNPMWPEITRELLPGQTAVNRHDIVARVFHLKLLKLKQFILEGQVYGEVQCYMHSIEWQKRGLPHAHILVWMVEKLRSAQVDNCFSAEIPDKAVDPVLYDIVIKHMVHGPCGPHNPASPCMDNDKCKKKYPKQFRAETRTDRDGYSLYRRRKPADGGQTAKILRQGQELTIDNRWIVPYSSILSKIFNAQINVESCNSVKSIKYVCKYINKGSDQAVFTLEDGLRNEVAEYLTGRYIFTNEAVWRILRFPIHERQPTVERLAIHLENGQRVVFN
ncbi:hypothetical protein ACOMHN_046037 [Nucella lapillus]